MEPNYLFGLSKYAITKIDPEVGILSGHIFEWGQETNITGTPCVVLKHTKTMDSENFWSLVPMSWGLPMEPRSLIEAQKGQYVIIKVGEKSDFFDRLKTIEVDRLDVSKLNRALDFVRTNGAMTLIVNSTKTLVADLNSVITLLSNKFKIRSILTNSNPGLRTLMEGDKATLAFSMIDLKQSVPVFNSGVVDGVVINCVIMYPKASEKDDRLVYSSEFTVLFADNDAITKVDGQSFRKLAIHKPEKILQLVKDLPIESIGQTKKQKVQTKVSLTSISDAEMATLVNTNIDIEF